MSEDENKDTDEDIDILSMVDSLRDDSDEESPEIKPEVKPEVALPPKPKKKVVPVIVRPPKKIEPVVVKPLIVKPKPKQEFGLESINEPTPSIEEPIQEAPEPIQEEEKPTSKLTLDDLASTVLDELGSELDSVEEKKATSSFKLDLKHRVKVESDFEIKEKETYVEEKKEIPSSYKISIGKRKKLSELTKDVYVYCPFCGNKFETLETEDIICPKCRKMFNR